MGGRGPRRSATAAVLTLGLLFASTFPLAAGTCSVPGTHDSIQEAVLDSLCTSIDVTATTYNESIDITRSMAISGPGGGGAVIEGSATVRGSGTQVSLNDLTVQNGCTPDSVQVGAGAELEGINFTVLSDAALPCPIVLFIFNDGFETGDTSFWSAAVN